MTKTSKRIFERAFQIIHYVKLKSIFYKNIHENQTFQKFAQFSPIFYVNKKDQANCIRIKNYNHHFRLSGINEERNLENIFGKCYAIFGRSDFVM